jgi:septal ring factor EnvC (AmiA/AmiB activator)
MATLTNPAAEIATLSSRYAAVAGRTSTVRAALASVEREIAAINDAVDAEEDGAEVDFARLPALRSERARLADALAPLAAEEQYAVRGLAAYGIETF